MATQTATAALAAAPAGRENPIGLNGFEFVEFSGPDPEALARMFEALGFTHRGTHKRLSVRHYRQGDINFLINMEKTGHSAEFRRAHGPSASAMAFRVRDDEAALRHALARGAMPVDGIYGFPVVDGIGGSLLYLVDEETAATFYDKSFNIEGEAGAGVGLPPTRTSGSRTWRVPPQPASTIKATRHAASRITRGSPPVGWCPRRAGC